MDSVSLQYLLVTYFHRNRAGRPKKEFALSLVIESTRNNCFVATTSRHPSSDSCRDKPLSSIAGYWLSIVWAKKPKAEVQRPPPPLLLSKPWLAVFKVWDTHIPHPWLWPLGVRGCDDGVAEMLAESK